MGERIEALEEQVQFLNRRIKVLSVATGFVAVGATAANLNLLGRSTKEISTLGRFDTPQALSEEIGNQKALNSDRFEGNIVTDRELRLRVSGTNNFQRFEMPKDLAPEPPTK